jgi:hypothetical protein
MFVIRSRPFNELKGFVCCAYTTRREACSIRGFLRGLGFSGLDMEYIVMKGSFKVWGVSDSTQGLYMEFEVHLWTIVDQELANLHRWQWNDKMIL